MAKKGQTIDKIRIKDDYITNEGDKMTINLATESPEARKHRLEHQREINRRYYLAHKDDPEWVARHKASNKRSIQEAQRVWDKNALQRFTDWIVGKDADQVADVVWQVMSTRSKKSLIRLMKED